MLKCDSAAAGSDRLKAGNAEPQLGNSVGYDAELGLGVPGVYLQQSN